MTQFDSASNRFPNGEVRLTRITGSIARSTLPLPFSFQPVLESQIPNVLTIGGLVLDQSWNEVVCG